jgi:hypothetical protein
MDIALVSLKWEFGMVSSFQNYIKMQFEIAFCFCVSSAAPEVT